LIIPFLSFFLFSFYSFEQVRGVLQDLTHLLFIRV